MVTIEKSELDKKSYRIIQLENGLRAVLISDLKPGEDPADTGGDGDDSAESGSEESDNAMEEDAEDDECAAKKPSKKVQMSAAAVCVNAGSFHESNEVQGLAHYLEHMVFMGSKKYPTENDFDSFVSQRGGSYNAWTDCERTLFYFDVHRRYFRDTLDRFANFFVAPLLLPGSMDREVTAVDSEYKMSLSHDAWRVEHFLGTLADPDHPYSFFMIGNVESLKTDPMAKGIDVYKNLQDRRERMYSAQYTTVAVQSKESLDDLEKLVRDILSDMPNNGKERPVVPKRNPFKNDRYQGKLYKLVPIKDVRKLILSWILPPLSTLYKSRPYGIFGFLLGHEAKGSILSYLRKKNLAVALTAGCFGGGFELNECATLIRVEVSLTEEGLEQIDDVIEAIFSYCAILRKKGLPENVFSDMQQLAANGFRFQEEQEPIDNVCSLAENLQKFPDEHLISGNKVLYEYAADLYAEVLQNLVPHEANYLLLSMTHESEDNKVEKWYDIRYSGEDIPKEKLDKWMNIQPDETVFHLPNKNEFIAKNFNLIQHDEKYTKEPVKLELPADSKSHGTLWYMQDTQFKMPKAMVSIRFLTPTFLDDPKSYVKSKIFIEILNQNLADITYDAEEADLRYNLWTGTNGIEMSVDGFNDKLFKLYTTIVDTIRDFSTDEDKFLACKEKVRQELVNHAYQPRKLYTELQVWSLYAKGTLVTDLISLLRGIELSDIEHFAKACWKPAHLLMYVHGNHTSDEALEYFTYTKKQLDLEPWDNIERQLCAKIPEGLTGCRVMNLNPCDVNTVIVDFYQVGVGDLLLSVQVQLLNEILNEPCFNFLRTKETLGYAVWFRRFTSSGILGMSVHVESQADKFTVDHCHCKMREFIFEEAKGKLEGLSQKDFDMYVSSLVASKLVEDVNMGQPMRRYWDEILSDNLLFDRLNKEVCLLKNVKKKDITDLFERCFMSDSRRQLVFQINALENPKKSVGDEKIYSLPIQIEERKKEEECSVKWITKLDQLREARQFYPYTRVV